MPSLYPPGSVSPRVLGAICRAPTPRSSAAPSAAAADGRADVNASPKQAVTSERAAVTGMNDADSRDHPTVASSGGGPAPSSARPTVMLAGAGHARALQTQKVLQGAGQGPVQERVCHGRPRALVEVLLPATPTAGNQDEVRGAEHLGDRRRLCLRCILF